jgi:hypothetical protein
MPDPVGETEGGTVIFSRGGGGGGRHAAEDPRRSGRHSAGRQSDEINGGLDSDGFDDDDFDDLDGDDLDGNNSNGAAGGGFRDGGGVRGTSTGRPKSGERAVTGSRPDRVPARSGAQSRPARHDAYAGPYDISEAPVGQLRVDLGSLQIPSIEDVEVRVQANEGVIQQVVLAHGASALQLGAFAAPRTEGIWDEVRAEIRKSLFNDGVAAEEIPGEFGVELRARVRAAEGMMDLRFIGIDGPRWMLRAVYQGEAAADPGAAGPLALCLRGLVVDRGREAMPVRDALPLRLPREMAEQVNAQIDAGQVDGGQVNGGRVNDAQVNGGEIDAPATDTATGHSAQQARRAPQGSVYGGGVNSLGGDLNGGGLNGANTTNTTSNGTPSNGTAYDGTTSNGTAPNSTAPNGIGSNGTASNSTAARGNAANGSANGHLVHGSSVRGNPVDDTSMNGGSGGEYASETPSGSDAAQRRRPSPRPRRSE